MTFNSIIRRSATAQEGFFVGFAIIFAFFSSLIVWFSLHFRALSSTSNFRWTLFNFLARWLILIELLESDHFNWMKTLIYLIVIFQWV